VGAVTGQRDHSCHCCCLSGPYITAGAGAGAGAGATVAVTITITVITCLNVVIAAESAAGMESEELDGAILRKRGRAWGVRSILVQCRSAFRIDAEAEGGLLLFVKRYYRHKHRGEERRLR